MDELVQAIRTDKLVGNGSCTVIDECFSDDELVGILKEREINTPEEAVKWARDQEGSFLEQACNARWGEDDDPQLKDLEDWKQQCNNEAKEREELVKLQAKYGQ